MSQASASVKVMRSAKPLGLRAAAAQLDHGRGGIHAVHPRHVAEADQEPHSRPAAAAEIDARHPGADAGPLGQIHRRAEAADVDLLAHDQFPQLAFGAAVNGLHVAQTDVRKFFIRISMIERR